MQIPSRSFPMPLWFVVEETCCPRGSTCWQEHRRSASPGWPCRYVSVELRYIPVRSLYLYLEDSFQRIQSLLFDLTPPSLHFAMMAEQLHSGLVEQIA